MFSPSFVSWNIKQTRKPHVVSQRIGEKKRFFWLRELSNGRYDEIAGGHAGPQLTVGESSRFMDWDALCGSWGIVCGP